MRKFIVFLIFFAINFNFLNSKKIPITYLNYISIVLQNNLKIKIIKLEKNKAKNIITLKKGSFDPTFYSKLEREYSKIYNTPTETYIDFSSGLYGKLYTGTEYSLNFQEIKHNNFDDYYYNQLKLTLTQPFLKNFGIKINKTEIEKAKLNLRITEKQIEDYINNIIFNATVVYWQLYNAYYKLKASEESLQNALNIHKINLEKYRLKMIPKSQLIESYAEVKSKEEALIKFKQEFLDLNDKLKKIMNLLGNDNVYFPISKPIIKKNIINEKDAIKIALKNRYEIVKKRYERKIEELNAEFYKNQKLPELNLNFEASINGKNDNFRSSIDKFDSGNYHEWKIGLEFKYPLGNRINKSLYKISKIKLNQIKLEENDIRNQIILEVKNALRDVKSNIKKIEAAKEALDSAKEKLRVETGKFKEGLSTPFKVFRYQRDYTDAKYRYIDALTSYMISIYHLKKVLGVKLWVTL